MNQTERTQRHLQIMDRPQTLSIEEKLLEQFALGYKPATPASYFYSIDGAPQFYLLRDLPIMLTHPHIGMCLEYVKAGIAGAEFETTCESQEVGKWGEEQMRRFWDRGIPKLQTGYDWGWSAGESMYEEKDGRLQWSELVDFHPRDAYLLTQNSLPVGIRVKHVPKRTPVDLWFSQDDIPAKGLWYAHNPRYNMNYGYSQCYLAWRPWRRLASQDAAETVVDTGVYRFAFRGPIVRYPSDSYQQPTTGMGPTLPLGTTFQYARDAARMMAEQMKAGASIALPAEKFPQERGGDFKWIVEWPDHTIEVGGLLEYVKYLKDEIAYGIGVPPELLQAQDTGSGYSGRAIPMEAFYMMQQKFADAFVMLFLKQVLRPLILRNFGDVKFDIKAKNLLQTKKMAQQGMNPQKNGQQQNGQQIPGMPNPQAQSGGGAVAFSLEAAKNRILTLAKLPQGERMRAGWDGLRLLSVATGLGDPAVWEEWKKKVREAA